MAGAADKHDIIGEIVNSIRMIRNIIQCQSKELMAKFRITGPQLGALRLVYLQPMITLTELSEGMYLHISTVSGIVDRLEERKYLRRHRRSEDKRTLNFILTEKGKAVIESSPPTAFGLMVLRLDKLSVAELRRIRHSIRVILNIMDLDKPESYIKTANSVNKLEAVGKVLRKK